MAPDRNEDDKQDKEAKESTPIAPPATDPRPRLEEESPTTATERGEVPSYPVDPNTGFPPGVDPETELRKHGVRPGSDQFEEVERKKAAKEAYDPERPITEQPEVLRSLNPEEEK